MRSTLTFLLLLLLMGCVQNSESVYISPQQLAYQEMEMVGFIHFTMTGSASGPGQRAATIGYKRILRIDELSTSKIRVVVDQSIHPPIILNPGLYLSSEKERKVIQ